MFYMKIWTFLKETNYYVFTFICVIFVMTLKYAILFQRIIKIIIKQILLKSISNLKVSKQRTDTKIN